MRPGLFHLSLVVGVVVWLVAGLFYREYRSSTPPSKVTVPTSEP